jgi:hypothetical protein
MSASVLKAEAHRACLFGRFFVRPEVPFLRPGLHLSIVLRVVAVNTGRRPPPEAARSGVDGREHSTILG